VTEAKRNYLRTHSPHRFRWINGGRRRWERLNLGEGDWEGWTYQIKLSPGGSYYWGTMEGFLACNECIASWAERRKFIASLPARAYVQNKDCNDQQNL
jgi:hypothetical protein